MQLPRPSRLVTYDACALLLIAWRWQSLLRGPALVGAIAPWHFEWAEKRWFFSHLLRGELAWLYPATDLGHSLATNPASGLLILPNWALAVVPAPLWHLLSISAFSFLWYRGVRRLLASWEQLADDERFDTITCLATYEHLQSPELFWHRCARHLSPEGNLLMTVPRPFVDEILGLAVRLKLLAGMDHQAHRQVSDQELRELPKKFQLAQVCSVDFMLGLNRFLVYRHHER